MTESASPGQHDEARSRRRSSPATADRSGQVIDRGVQHLQPADLSADSSTRIVAQATDSVAHNPHSRSLTPVRGQLHESNHGVTTGQPGDFAPLADFAGFGAHEAVAIQETGREISALIDRIPEAVSEYLTMRPESAPLMDGSDLPVSEPLINQLVLQLGIVLAPSLAEPDSPSAATKPPSFIPTRSLRVLAPRRRQFCARPPTTGTSGRRCGHPCL
jgi:hypothetical protein